MLAQFAMRPPAGGVAVDLGAIRDVWAYNLKEEMEKMRDIGEDYPSVLQFAHLDVFPIELCNEHRYFVVCFRKDIPKRKHR